MRLLLIFEETLAKTIVDGRTGDAEKEAREVLAAINAARKQFWERTDGK